MAITTVNQALSGMQPLQTYNKAVSATLVAGRPHSYWSAVGGPGPGTFSSSLNGRTNSQTSALVAGAIPFYDPPGGQNSYLARFQGMTTGTQGTLLLCDRLWENGGFDVTLTSAQTISAFSGLPARDNTGTANGVGVYLAVEVSAATTTNAPTITVSYTNSSGVAGHSATSTNGDVTLASSAIGAFYRLGLQSGDYGVQSVASLTLSVSWTTGTINLVAYRVLAAMEVQSVIPNSIDAVTSGFPQLFNGTTPWVVFVPGATTATSLTSQFVASQG